MKVTTDIRSEEWVGGHMAEALDHVRAGGNPMVIMRHGAAAAVLMDAEAYDNLKQGIALLRIMELGKADIRAGRCVTLDQLDRDIETWVAAG